MKKTACAPLLLLAAVAAGQTKSAQTRTPKPETPHLQFVNEYVRELNEAEAIQKHGQKELAEAKTMYETYSASIYFSKSMQLELRSEIAILKSMRLNGRFDVLIPTLIASYQRQIQLHQQLIDIGANFVAGPKDGVDYQALAAKMPEIRAEVDDARKVVFDVAAYVFMTLIDMKPDSQGHISHLIISKADKAALQDHLDLILKDEPDKGDHDFYISAAMILRGCFQKGHKCADEPWE